MIRVPKPPQSWRGLSWEVGVVVVGVLIALGAQQLVDALYWRGQAQQAMRAIERELLEHERDAYERLAVQPCLKRQVAAISKRLATHRGEWTAMPMIVTQQGDWRATQDVLPSAYRSPNRLWSTEAWATARSSGALNHMPDTTVARIAQAYNIAERIDFLEEEEVKASSSIAALALDGPISDNMRIELLGLLSLVDRANSGVESAADQQLDDLRNILSRVPREERAAAIAGRIRDQRGFRGACVLPLELKT